MLRLHEARENVELQKLVMILVIYGAMVLVSMSKLVWY